MMHFRRCAMVAFLRFASCSCRATGAAAPNTLAAFRSTFMTSRRIENHRMYHSSSSNGGGADDIQHTTDAPYFPIYYNDVYEVDLPRGHRFPMGKYRKVREAFQKKVGTLSEEEQRRVHCGKHNMEHLIYIVVIPNLFHNQHCFTEFRVSPLATTEQLVTTHDAHYVHRYLTGDMTERENRNIGFPWR